MKNRSIACIAMFAASAWFIANGQAAPQPTPGPIATAGRAVEASVRVDAAWVRTAPPGAMMLAGYMTLHNDGKVPVRFEWAQSDVFGTVELHRSLVVNGMDTMRPAGAQTIPAGGELRFAPGGLHLMLMDARRPLQVGDVVRFRLHFAGGVFVDVAAPVRATAP